MNKTFIFKVSQDIGFISPRFRVEHVENLTTRSQQFHSRNLHNCFFSGKIVGEDNSDVVMNICNGLVSL